MRDPYLVGDADTREIPAARPSAVRPDPERIIAAVCAEAGVSREALLRKGFRGVWRGLLMVLLYRYGGLRQQEIGVLLGVDYSAVSISRKRFEHRMREDRNVRLLAEMLGEMLQRD